MKIFRFLIPLFLLVTSAFSQVNLQQPSSTGYLDNSVPRRNGTANKMEGTTVLITDTNGINVPGSITSASFTSGRVPFASTAGLLVDSTSLTFNSGTGALTATTFIGALTGNASTATTATNATNTAVTDDTTTNATMYLTWVTAATGNLPQKLSSTKLTFNPSTGLLSSTGFAGTGSTAGYFQSTGGFSANSCGEYVGILRSRRCARGWRGLRPPSYIWHWPDARNKHIWSSRHNTRSGDPRRIYRNSAIHTLC